MTYRTADGKAVIAAEDESRCQACGILAELRPYGPNGERICYACGMKNQAATERQFSKRILGESIQ